MILHTEGERLLAGVRCGKCGRFLAVAEGAAIPYCCVRVGELYPHSLLLEHHTLACLEGCGFDSAGCQCPCHLSRERKAKR